MRELQSVLFKQIKDSLKYTTKGIREIYIIELTKENKKIKGSGNTTTKSKKKGNSDAGVYKPETGQ